MDIKAKVRQFILEDIMSSSPDDNLKDDSSFLGMGIIDSTGILELVAFLEETCHIKIEDEELIPGNLDSVNQLVAFIQRKDKNMDK
jgi:acyl carrier protein